MANMRPRGTSVSHCDAVVVGAGLSGLTAAAFLTEAGARVRVCEQADQVGGLFRVFRRSGYHCLDLASIGSVTPKFAAGPCLVS